MAQLKIAGNVKIGHVYECIFGLFKSTTQPQAPDFIQETTTDKASAVDDDYNYRIPNELIKKRPVIVIGKHRGLYIVVPISTTRETDKKEAKNPDVVGFHVKLEDNDMPVTSRYAAGEERWAKSNMLATVDGGRLRDLYEPKTRRSVVAHKVSDATLLKVRHGVLISIGLRDMLK